MRAGGAAGVGVQVCLLGQPLDPVAPCHLLGGGVAGRTVIDGQDIVVRWVDQFGEVGNFGHRLVERSALNDQGAPVLGGQFEFLLGG